MVEHQKARISRRTVLKTGLKAGLAGVAGTGFALAVQPISAQTIHTPAEGLVTRDAELLRGKDRLPYYLARPEGQGRFPAVIVIHEIFGLHEHIRDVTRRFAREGFLAGAPQLYFRQGDVSGLGSIQEIFQVVQAVPDRQMLDDLGALLIALKGMPECNGKVGATGFCWGGGATWLFVADQPGLSAGVAWYGRLTNWADGSALHPKNPVELADRMHGPMLGLYGEADSGIPVAQVEAMKAALRKAGKPHEFVVYPGAPHAFFADYRPSYRPEAAKDGWARCLAWFRRHLA
jgi:carboxymethylenebutenolidase